MLSNLPMKGGTKQARFMAGRYFALMAMGLCSMFVGGSIVHNIMKPDLTIPDLRAKDTQDSQLSDPKK